MIVIPAAAQTSVVLEIFRDLPFLHQGLSTLPHLSPRSKAWASNLFVIFGRDKVFTFQVYILIRPGKREGLFKLRSGGHSEHLGLRRM